MYVFRASQLWILNSYSISIVRWKSQVLFLHSYFRADFCSGDQAIALGTWMNNKRRMVSIALIKLMILEERHKRFVKSFCLRSIMGRDVLWIYQEVLPYQKLVLPDLIDLV